MSAVVLNSCSAFEGYRLIAAGDPCRVALKTKRVIDRGQRAQVLIFDDTTGRQLEFDLRGSDDDVLARFASPNPMQNASTTEGESPARRGPGRPKLGVVAHEVTLLPRHWEWLERQPGGASVTLRKLVEQARHANEATDRIRDSTDAAYRFMVAIAGNLPGFEEATRALFAVDSARFTDETEPWPKDIRAHARKLAAVAFEASQAALKVNE
jgi:uncharacterized protein